MRRTKPPVGWEHVKNCFPVPNELLEFDLPGGSIAVYLYLLRHADRRTGQCHPSTATMAKKLHYCTSTSRKVCPAMSWCMKRGRRCWNWPRSSVQSAERSPTAIFRSRKPGTGCISQINENLWEGRYSPKLPSGTGLARNVYAHSEEECEQKLADLIIQMKAEIAAQREQL